MLPGGCGWCHLLQPLFKVEQQSLFHLIHDHCAGGVAAGDHYGTIPFAMHANEGAHRIGDGQALEGACAGEIQQLGRHRPGCKGDLLTLCNIPMGSFCRAA